jgi:acyl-coenzyme A thioesterase PaaI-like protein
MAAQSATETINAWANQPTDEETLTLFEPTTENAHGIDAHIINHPLSKKLRGEKGWVESRPHMKIPPAMRQHNLTAGALQGDGKIEVPPLTFSEVEAPLPRMVQMTYFGSGLCGHPNIVHGGLLATMLDEGLARCCFHALPNKIGVTASLKIDYRAPCPGNSYVVLKAETIKVEGRKAWVKGWIEVLGEEDGTGVKLVEAEALFIEPKGAKQMARIYSAT